MSGYKDSFNTVAAEYDVVRPRYPADSIHALLEQSGLRPGDRVVEFGAGTGILTSELLTHGINVTAVEPGSDLLREARKKLGEYEADGRLILVGNTALGAVADGQLNSLYDGAVMGTARKWIDDTQGRFRRAVHGLLRPEAADRPAACISAIHNTTAVRDNGGGDFFDASREIYQRHMNAGNTLPFAADLRPEGFGSGFAPVHFSANLQPMSLDAQSYIDLINTYGPIIDLDPEARLALNRDLTELITAQFAGNVTLVHAVTLEVAQRAG